MPRSRRLWYPGACYHIMGRGNRHCRIFGEREDYDVFLMLMEKVKNQYPYTLHAYCLMTNHFHLELTTIDVPIWEIMKPIMNHYAKIYNKINRLDGHLFDSRYTSCLIEDDVYFLEVSRYIHLNPVKAGMVRDPSVYEYSSCSIYTTDTPDKESMVDTARVLSYFQPDPYVRYRLFLNEQSSHEEHEILIRKDMKEDEIWLPG